MTREPLTRRAFAGAAAALALLPTIAAADAAQTPSGDPVLPLYAEWRSALSAWRELCAAAFEWESAEMEALWARKVAACEALGNTIPTTPDGIAAVAHVLWDEHLSPDVCEDDPHYIEEFWSGQNRLLFNIWQAATGKTMIGRGPFKIDLKTESMEA